MVARVLVLMRRCPPPDNNSYWASCLVFRCCHVPTTHVPTDVPPRNLTAVHCVRRCQQTATAECWSTGNIRVFSVIGGNEMITKQNYILYIAFFFSSWCLCLITGVLVFRYTPGVLRMSSHILCRLRSRQNLPIHVLIYSLYSSIRI